MYKRTHSLKSRFTVGTAVTLLSLSANATSTLTLQPASALSPTSQELRTVASGDVSSGLQTWTYGNGQASTQGSANDLTGTLRAYASIDASAGIQSWTNDLWFASTATFASGSVKIKGSGQDPVPVSLRLQFDGNFLAAENTFSALQAQIGAGDLTAITRLVSDTDNIIEQRFTQRSFTDANGTFISVDDPRAFVSIASASLDPIPGALAGTLGIDLMLTPGTSTFLSFGLVASVQLQDTTVGGFGGTMALNTAKVQFILPQGYSVEGDNGFLSQAVVQTVPEPMSASMMALGIAGLAAYYLRRRQPASLSV